MLIAILAIQRLSFRAMLCRNDTISTYASRSKWAFNNSDAVFKTKPSFIMTYFCQSTVHPLSALNRKSSHSLQVMMQDSMRMLGSACSKPRVTKLQVHADAT